MIKKSYSFDMETFRDMFQICPKIPGKKFVDPPFKEEILAFLSNLGYPGNIKTLSEHEVIQKYGAILLDNLTNQLMKESKSYKTYYAFATGKAIPKPKYVHETGHRKKQNTTSQLSTQGSGAHEGTGVTPGVPDAPTYEYDDEQISWKSSKDEDDCNTPKLCHSGIWVWGWYFTDQ
nr:hypothetical protein [Tanacetum cinerariifolium]